MKMYRSILGITLLCLILPLAGPSNVSALSIDLDGCLLDVGVTCDLPGTQFFVTERNGNPDDPLVGSLFAKVSVSVEAFNPGAFPQNTDLVEFEYRYQIYDQQFAVTNFLLHLDLVPPPAVLDSGSISDADSNTIAPISAAYVPQDLLYSAVFLGPPILPVSSGVIGSDVLFIRTSTSPGVPQRSLAPHSSARRGASRARGEPEQVADRRRSGRAPGPGLQVNPGSPQLHDPRLPKIVESWLVGPCTPANRR